jgi:hypothetical protein
VKAANQDLTIDGAGSDTINGAATIANTAAEADQAAIELYRHTAGKWVVTSRTGTWG